MCQGVHFGLFAKTSSQVATIFECKSRLEAADVLPQELQASLPDMWPAIGTGTFYI